jgi:hypothetical protein
VLVTAQHRQQAAREQQLARGAQLRVAQPPAATVALAPLRDEVDADRAPVAHEVVEQEARRAAILERVAQVVLHDVEPDAREHVRMTDRDGLQHEQQPPRHVGVGVVVQADAQQLGRVHDAGEDARPAGPLEARRVAHEARGDVLGRRARRSARQSAHEHDVVVVGAARQLVPAPRAHQDDRGPLVDRQVFEQRRALPDPPPRACAGLQQRGERCSGLLLQALERCGGGAHAGRC